MDKIQLQFFTTTSASLKSRQSNSFLSTEILTWKQIQGWAFSTSLSWSFSMAADMVLAFTFHTTGTWLLVIKSNIEGKRQNSRTHATWCARLNLSGTTKSWRISSCMVCLTDGLSQLSKATAQVTIDKGSCRSLSTWHLSHVEVSKEQALAFTLVESMSRVRSLISSRRRLSLAITSDRFSSHTYKSEARCRFSGLKKLRSSLKWPLKIASRRISWHSIHTLTSCSRVTIVYTC